MRGLDISANIAWDTEAVTGRFTPSLTFIDK